MPGILPMKVIKIGTSAQSRIAQACDRCRSKKIRCDGLRPCCTQCSSVGFECKTSDKLSRRAFPRGYTESLEERVRALESEIKELKDLLDEKDEKIDMLSRISSQSPRKLSTTPPLVASASPPSSSVSSDSKDLVKVQRRYSLVAIDGADSYFTGSSSARAFIDAFAIKTQESGRSCSALKADKLLKPVVSAPVPAAFDSKEYLKSPPRLLSDQMMNIFVQEWLPLFPILHRPTLLKQYEEYVETIPEDKEPVAILNLVFGIATLSSEHRFSYDAASCEGQWVSALDSFIQDSSLATLQCLVLAQIFYLLKGDHSRLLHYKSIAIGMAQRLGLHTSQKSYAFHALASETRKKVFWTLYTVDCFSAAALGLPTLLRDEDIDCEYPVDADDENVTAKGFRPGNPGESTRLSSALALFRGARILSKVLAQEYSATASRALSLQTISALDEELETWSNNLAPHLRLEFVQDKPATLTISSRCPFLSLTYHYIRSLIHRPAAISNLGDKASSSALALASSSKRIVQILELLEERHLSFSFCLNQQEVLVLSGLGILLQAMDLEKTSKLMQDSRKTTQIIVTMMKRDCASGASAFNHVTSFMGDAGFVKHEPVVEPSDVSNSTVEESMPMLPPHLGFAQKQLAAIASKSHFQAIAARYTLSPAGAAIQEKAKELHRASMPNFATSSATPSSIKSQFYSSQPMCDPLQQHVPRPASAADFVPHPQPTTSNGTSMGYSTSTLNLDYFNFDELMPSSKHGRQSNASVVQPDILFNANSVSPHDIHRWSRSEESVSPADRKVHTFDEAELNGFVWPTSAWEFDTPPSDLAFPCSNSDTSLSDGSFTSSEAPGSTGRGSIGCEDAFASITMPDFTSLDADSFDCFHDTINL